MSQSFASAISSLALTQLQLRWGSSNASPPFTQHLPLHPNPCPSPAQSTLHALLHSPFWQWEPCSFALLPIIQLQCILLLLNAVVWGKTFQYAQMEPWGNLPADTSYHYWAYVNCNFSQMYCFTKYEQISKEQLKAKSIHSFRWLFLNSVPSRFVFCGCSLVFWDLGGFVGFFGWFLY